jgi:hypothetical protein
LCFVFILNEKTKRNWLRILESTEINQIRLEKISIFGDTIVRHSQHEMRTQGKIKFELRKPALDNSLFGTKEFEEKNNLTV